MKSQILIDVEAYMTSVALVEDGRINEYYVEYNDSDRRTGNIYKGRVENVLQGLQTAFVNIGLKRNAFLYVGETLDHRSVLSSAGVVPSVLNVKPGDYVMVQVTKEETAEKGARLTMNLSLPGRYVVYLPTMDFVGVSGKITDGETRDRLTKLLTRLKPVGGGLIARTVSIDAKKSEIVAEVKQITAMYRDIVKAYEAAGEHTALVHSEGNLIVRTVRDMLSADVDAIVCNDREMTDELVARLKKSHPRFAGMVHLYEGEYDMSDAYGILDGVEKLLHKRVDLPSGGSIVIEPTEALTAIDVNTGRYSGDVDHEDTVFRTNLEAAEEIARQLRLRNIGGIVVIDFIDMADEKHKAAVVEALKKEMLLDRTKTRVLGMSDMGLVELTRKKIGRDIGKILLTECPACHGNAYTPSADFLARKIKCRLKRLFADGGYAGALVTVHASHFNHMFQSGFFTRECETEWADKRIYIVPSASVRPQEFIVHGVRTAMMNLPPSARLLY